MTTHKWLPSQPTNEMVNAANSINLAGEWVRPSLGDIYKAMWKSAPEVEQEPVAFIDMKMFPPIRFPDRQLRCDVEHLDGHGLYARTQSNQSEQSLDMVKRKPLSEKEIRVVYDTVWSAASDLKALLMTDTIRFVRAI